MATNEDLITAIVNDLKKYTDEKEEKIEKAVRKRTNDYMLKAITNQSPVRQKKYTPKSGVIKTKGQIIANHQPGSYKKGWMKYISTAVPHRITGYVRNRTRSEARRVGKEC